jgi:DNA invertase Pin-like site-specific DNA recombinase
MISARTKAALAAAKARGKLLGSANPKIRTKAVAGLAAAAVASAKQADQRAEELVALIDGIRQAGATTLQLIADALNARGIPTARGGQWHPTTVRNAVRRAA